MNKEELKEKFYHNVEYLMKIIPPDDIYLFAEETFMAALFFLHRWSEHVDINEVVEKDEVTKKWVSNIIGLHVCRDRDMDIKINLNLESVEGE